MTSGDIALLISLALCIPCTVIAVCVGINIASEIFDNWKREVGK